MVDTATVSQFAHLGAGIAIGFGAVGAGRRTPSGREEIFRRSGHRLCG